MLPVALRQLAYSKGDSEARPPIRDAVATPRFLKGRSFWTCSLRKIYIALSAWQNGIPQRGETKPTSCPIVSRLSFSFPAIPFRSRNVLGQCAEPQSAMPRRWKDSRAIYPYTE
jgi:hypothetical protein